jgi:esterase
MLDLPGHGQSPPVVDDADLGALAAAVHATVASWHLPRPPKVVGHSLGGRVALAWLRDQPTALAEVALLDIAPGPLPTSDSRRVLDILLRAPDQAPDRRTFRTFLVEAGMSLAKAEWLLMNVVCDAHACHWRIDRAALSRLQDRVSSEDLWSVVERANVPLRCLRGRLSPYVTDVDVARLRELGCSVDTLEGAGHDVHVEALDEVVRLLG